MLPAEEYTVNIGTNTGGGNLKLKHSDLCFEYLCTGSKYRGKGIMGDLISYMANVDGITGGTVSLYVKIHNFSAIKCYEKSGFKITRRVRLFHIRYPFDFPKYSL